MSDDINPGPSGHISDVLSEESEHERPSRSRKRKLKVSEWKQNVAKDRRNRGLSYVSEKTGKLVPARKMQGSCSCTNKCFEKVSEEARKEIHENFWKLGEYNRQNEYLSKLLKSKIVKRRRKPVESLEKFRRHSVSYFVYHGDIEYPVCKKAFLNIFNLGEKRIKTVLEKQSRTGTTTPDRRGEGPPAVTISDARVEVAKEHIEKLPTVSSHYTRAKSPNRKYLTQDLNIKKLYTLYQDYATENYPDLEPVSESKYRKIFNEEYNIGFAPPKTDTCNTCDLIQANIDNFDESNPSPRVSKVELETTLAEHKSLAEKGQRILAQFNAKYGEDEEVLGACFDLQQTLPTPKLSTGVAYYKRKLWTYNFGIFNLKEQKATMYVWDEVTARRGSIEITSALCHWIEENQKDETHLILFSDNCAGQNKNLNMVLSNLRMIHQGKFFRIEHYFLVPGHSYMPCDQKFGNIELALRKRPNIETKDDYIRIIKSAVRGGFKVVAFEQSQVLDFNVLQDSITKRKSKELNFQDARVIIFDTSYKEGYAIKEDYEDDTPQHKVRLMPGRKGYSRALFNLGTVDLRPKYQAPIPLTQEKIKDLKDLLVYIHPSHKAEYFHGIIRAQETIGLAPPDAELEEQQVDDVEDNLLDYVS